jgi:membrane protein implicated in regulation of membrane protease activity
VENKKEDIKFFIWEMGRFLKHFLIFIILFALCGSYVIVLILGKEDFLAANNYLAFILTIIASVLSIVSLALSYHNTKQAQDMQKEFGEKLSIIQDRLLPSTDKQKTVKDWKEKDEGR